MRTSSAAVLVTRTSSLKKRRRASRMNNALAKDRGSLAKVARLRSFPSRAARRPSRSFNPVALQPRAYLSRLRARRTFSALESRRLSKPLSRRPVVGSVVSVRQRRRSKARFGRLIRERLKAGLILTVRPAREPRLLRADTTICPCRQLRAEAYRGSTELPASDQKL